MNLSLFTSHFSREGKRVAFTLAETLITLGIIGVVAAMTLPSVINNFKVKQYETGFKVAYSLLSQAVKKINSQDIIVSENVTCGACTTEYVINSECLCFPLMLYKNFNGATNLRNRPPSVNYKSFDGSSFSNLIMDDGFFELPNGMTVYIEIQDSTNNPVIITDTNGYKKPPNRYGFDTFAFIIGYGDKLYGMGDPNVIFTGPFRTNGGRRTWPVSSYCNSEIKTNTNGFSCAYKALSEVDYWKKLPR